MSGRINKGSASQGVCIRGSTVNVLRYTVTWVKVDVAIKETVAELHVIPQGMHNIHNSALWLRACVC